ncbi:MAG: helix-turn-helix domain-containing protein [Prevotella sp.]|nr:helix-turn-helix domain-containing protein [Prevotella sp.]
MKKLLPLILSLWSVVLPVAAQQQEVCPVIKLEAERLPDLNIPRAGHALFYANGELTVAGGHTNGFVPTPTAEYFKDGEWHTMQMTYTHDVGIAAVLKSGKVLLAGGCEQPAGIGQTIHAEIYDPQSHTFRGFGNLQRGRVWASAFELDSGQVVIAGNWYAQDGIELFHEHQSDKGDNVHKRSFTYIKDVSAQRSSPYIFRMADGDALILGNNSTRGDTLHCTFADRLKGDTLHIPLFDSWSPLNAITHDDAVSFIGDEPNSGYTYLMPVQDSTGQVAIARVSETDVSLLSTVCPIPMFCQGDSIEYFSNVIVDRQSHHAYLLGISSNFHAVSEKNPLYVLRIDYDQTSANGGVPMTLYYSQPMEVVPSCMPLLTPEGNLLIVGGLTEGSNYTPSSAVWLLRVGGEPEAASGKGYWMWILLGIIVLAAILWTIRWRKQKPTSAISEPVATPEAAEEDVPHLMQRINDIMESQKLYKNSELKLSDLANAVGSNRRAVSDCINSQAGNSFNQYVNTFRTEHAKRIIRQYPDRKLSDIYVESGFANETSFFRTFKALTGMTPKEWKDKGL